MAIESCRCDLREEMMIPTVPTVLRGCRLSPARDPTGAQQTRDRLRGRFPFVGSREWIGCCEACVALRSAGVRADVRGFDGRRDGLAARRLVTYLADYFKNVVGVGSDDVWGASCLPPALVCFGGHNRCVVGVSRDRRCSLNQAAGRVAQSG